MQDKILHHMQNWINIEETFTEVPGTKQVSVILSRSQNFIIKFQHYKKIAVEIKSSKEDL